MDKGLVQHSRYAGKADERVVGAGRVNASSPFVRSKFIDVGALPGLKKRPIASTRSVNLIRGGESAGA